MVMVACGWRHTISVSASGGLYTFGWSKYGQLGHGDFEDHLVPHKLEALNGSFISQVICSSSSNYESYKRRYSTGRNREKTRERMLGSYLVITPLMSVVVIRCKFKSRYQKGCRTKNLGSEPKSHWRGKPLFANLKFRLLTPKIVRRNVSMKSLTVSLFIL